MEAGTAGGSRGHLQRGRATKGGNKSPASRIRGLTPLPQSCSAAWPQRGVREVGGYPFQRVTHARLSGEGEKARRLCSGTRLALVAPKGFPLPLRLWVCLWEEAAPVSRASTLSFPASLYPASLQRKLHWWRSHQVLSQGQAPALSCHCWLTTRSHGTQEMEQRGQRTIRTAHEQKGFLRVTVHPVLGQGQILRHSRNVQGSSLPSAPHPE